MTKATRPPSRTKRTKAEVQQEFSEIREEVAAARESTDAKSAEQATLREIEVRRVVEGVSVEGVVQKISALGLEISKALADLSERLVQEVDRLAAVREAVALEQRETERIHKIDVAATALDQLVQDHARQKEQLDAEIAAQRDAWDREMHQTRRDYEEREEALKKQRQREVEDYEYKKLLERKKAQDKYEEEISLREKHDQEKQESLEKRWQEREAKLKEGEDELQRLRKDSEEFPARLKKEAELAAKQSAQATLQQTEQQLVLLKKENESERRLAALQIKTLEETIGHQSSQITALEAQVDEAKKQVQEIALRAIEGASGARALSHINEIAMEQAKHRSPQG